VKELSPALFEIRDDLGETHTEVEVYHKRGRSRMLRVTPHGDVFNDRQEEGWAVRAGDNRRSLFYAAAGTPRSRTEWPEADGDALRLPSDRLVAPWHAAPTFETPLISENAARQFFADLARELDTEIPGARLVLGEISDGRSESAFLTSRGTEAQVPHRVAALYLEATVRRRASAPTITPPPSSVTLKLAARSAESLTRQALAQRLADRLEILLRGKTPLRDRGELLLAPAVAVRLFAAMRDLWVGPQAAERVQPLIDRRGRIGSPVLHLIDDGRLPGGALEAPVDGEGQPTRAVTLVERGVFRQSLVAWNQALQAPEQISGCARRVSWRDLPQPGPTHLYQRPDESTSVGDLLAGMPRGYYLLDTESPARLDASRKRFAVRVCGFAIDGGRPTGAVSGAWLVGSVSTFLNSILAAARDLTFLPLEGGMIGSPTLLLKSLELRQRP